MNVITIGLNPAIDRILECPNFHLGGHQHARPLARLASGKAVNVSRALAQVSVNSVATGFLGRADLPFYHQQLDACGPGKITCRFTKVHGQTRENITILNPLHHQETHLRNPGFDVTSEGISHLENTLKNLLQPGAIAILSGSICQGLPSTYIATLLDICTAKGARVVVDSSGAEMKAAAREKMWLMKPNLEELQEILGTPVANDPHAIRDAALQLLDKAELVMVSRGRKGAVLLTRHGCFSGTTLLNREAVRTVTCGDHLVAGFVAAEIGGHDLEYNFRYAIALATARAFSHQLDQIDIGILGESLQRVKIEKIGPRANQTPRPTY